MAKMKIGRLVMVGTMIAALGAPTFSFAQPNDQVAALQAQIATLLAQVRELQAQLDQVRGGQSQPTFCFNWNRNLRVGDSGKDVVALQQALIREGLLDGDPFNGPFDDEFVERIAAALVGFQEKHRNQILVPNGLARGTGYGGPSTRAKLNALFGCGRRPIPPTPTPVPIPGPTPVPVGYQQLPNDPNISGSATLVSANKDRVFKWGANGRISGSDWEWNVSVVNGGQSSKAIKRMVLVHNTPGEGWATDASENNPVGKSLYLLGTALCERCDLFNIYTDNVNYQVPAAGAFSFYAYGYPGSWRFTGGYLLVEFTDGTSAMIRIPASDITPGGGGPTGNTATEQVKCVFNGATTQQSCGASDPTRGGIRFDCSGVVSCVANVEGIAGTQLTWKSSCGGYAYTTIDGQTEWANFSCSGTADRVTVISPNGNEAWMVGKTYTISYKNPSTNDSALIYLERGYYEGSTKTGVNSSMLIGQSAPGVQSFTYTVPETIASWPGFGTNYKIKVCMNNCSVNDTSDNYFSIAATDTPASITVTSPNGGEVWQQGATDQPIDWKNSPADLNPASTVDITIWQSSPQPGTLFTIAKNIPRGTYSGRFYWRTVGKVLERDALLEAGDYVITVCVSGTGVCDKNDSSFRITSANTQPSITITSPNGGEIAPVGGALKVSWNSSGVPAGLQVLMQIWKSANVVYSSYTNNDGYETFVVPSTIGIGNDFTLGILYKTSEGAVYDDKSDAPFTITAATTQPSITVISPNGGEIWKKKTEQKISWSIPRIVGGLETISQLYPLDISLEPYYPPCSGPLCPQYAFEGPYTIVKGIYANSNDFYAWKVGEIKDVNRSISDGSYKIKICRSDVSNVCDTSDAPFTITAATTQPSVVVTSPNGGESFALGAQIPVKWTQTFGSQTTIVYLIDTASQNVYTSAPFASVSGQNQWSMPGNAAPAVGSYRVNVCSLATPNSNYCDPSNAYFTITPVAAAASSLNSGEMASILESMKALLLQLGGSL